jgi:hypothetical protein
LGYADYYLDYATLFPTVSGHWVLKVDHSMILDHIYSILMYIDTLKSKPDHLWNLGDNGFTNIKSSKRTRVSEIRCGYHDLDEEQLLATNSSSIDNSWYGCHRNSDAKNASTSCEDNNMKSTE